MSCLEVDRLQQVVDIDGTGDGLTYLYLVEGRLAGVEGQEGHVHARLYGQAQFRVLLDHRQLAGNGSAHHIALARQQLGQAFGGFWRDVIDQLFNLGFAAPVTRVAQVTHIFVVAILLEAERTCPDRLGVQQCRCAGAAHLVGIFGGEHYGVVAGQRGEEGGIRPIQFKHHLQLSLLVDPLDQLIQPQAVEVGILAPRNGVIGVLLVQQPLPGEQHIVGIQVT